MVIKINYTSSDIYVSTNVSPVYVVVSYGGTDGGSAIWGQITGTLSNQTDLQNALNAKFDDPTGTTSQYLRGDGSLATFPTITSGTVTSVDMSVPTGLTISGNPITSSGTLAVGLASGYSIPTTASQATWNTAYNDSIVSAAVTGTTTKTLTLNQQDGGSVTASWSDLNTDAVTSVFGRTGVVVATGGDYTTTQVTEGTNLYYTEGRVSANSDVSANTAARHNAVTLGTANGLSLSTQALSLGLSSSSTNGALSSTDWSTFNAKQNAITLTTTGSSGSATLVGATLNIPSYSVAGLGAVPDSRTITINGEVFDLSANRSFEVGDYGTF